MRAPAPLARPRRAGAGLAALAAILGLGAGLGACSGEPAPTTEPLPAGMPAEPEAQALHCYLVLTLTIDQLEQFEGTGPQGGFLARRSSQELLQARQRVAAKLDPGLIEDIEASPRLWLTEVLERFDRDGDGQLAGREEVEAFNRHVSACTRLRSSP